MVDRVKVIILPRRTGARSDYRKMMEMMENERVMEKKGCFETGCGILKIPPTWFCGSIVLSEAERESSDIITKSGTPRKYDTHSLTIPVKVASESELALGWM